MGATERDRIPVTEDGTAVCAVGPAVDLVFSRWTTPILLALRQARVAGGRLRYVELQRQVATITPKVLTERLRQMERDGLVRRHYYAEVPPRAEYEITDLGDSLGPVFAALATWSAEHLPEVERARGAYDGARVSGSRTP
jgi:DNA-binding HxlR family transcriptional regulator